MATSREDKQSKKLANLQAMMGIYQQFSPEQKLREDTARQQLADLTARNQEFARYQSMRDQMAQLQLQGAQMGLQKQQQFLPHELQQLQREVESRGLANQRDTALLPFVTRDAESRVQQQEAAGRVATQGVPMELERMRLANALTDKQTKNAVTDDALRRVQIDAGRLALEQDAEMFPYKRAMALGNIQQGMAQSQPMFNPQPLPLSNDMIMKALSSGLVDDSEWKRQQNGGLLPPPRVPATNAIPQVLAGLAAGTFTPQTLEQELLRPSVGSPPGSSPQLHAFMSAVEQNPTMLQNPTIAEVYARLKAGLAKPAPVTNPPSYGMGALGNSGPLGVVLDTARQLNR